MEAVLFAANVHKFLDGGWLPLLIAAAVIAMVLVGRRDRAVLLARWEKGAQPLDGLIASLGGPEAPHRARGTAVYLTARRDVVPAALALNLRHIGVLHERVALLTVETDRRPRVPEAERLEAAALPAGFRLLTRRFGFAEAPDVPAARNPRARPPAEHRAGAAFPVPASR